MLPEKREAPSRFCERLKLQLFISKMRKIKRHSVAQIFRIKSSEAWYLIK